MKKYTTIICLFLLCAACIVGQDKILVHKDNVVLLESFTEQIEDILFQNQISKFNIIENNRLEIPIAEIDSITFDHATAVDNTVYIKYLNDEVAVINPFEDSEVNVTVNNSTVSVIANSSVTDIRYHLSGYTTTGSFTITSLNSIQLMLSNLQMQSPYSAAVNITNNIATEIILAENTSNFLADNANSTINATIYSKGDVTFNGSGSLMLAAYYKHAISSSNTILVENGNISILNAVNDGFHSENFIMNNGNLKVNASGDAIDAGAGNLQVNGGNIQVTSTEDDTKGLKCDGILTINKGIIDISVSGAQSKAFSSKSDIIINGGDIDIETSGKAVLEALGSGYDPSYCSAMKSKGDIIINEGDIHIESLSTCDGGKGLSADGSITINNGNIYIATAGNGATYTDETGAIDSYTSCCIKSDVNISILAGTITCISSGTGGKGISCDGEMILGTSNADNNLLTLNVTTSGERFLVSSGSSSGGGMGGGGMGGGGGNSMTLLFSSPQFTQGSYTLQYGGTISGSSSNGYYDSGSYSGGSSKSFSISNQKVTTVR